MDAGLKVRIRRIRAKSLRDFQNGVSVFLPGMKNENSNGDQQSVDGEGNDSRGSSKPRSEGGGKYESIFAAVEINRQGAGQHNAE